MNDIIMILGENALKKRFAPKKERQAEVMELKEAFEEPGIIPDRKLKLFLRMSRMQMDAAAVDIVLASSTPSKERIIRYRYQRNLGTTRLTATLGHSKACICMWHNEIIRKVGKLILFRPDADDLLMKTKVINIIYQLDLQIEMLEEYPSLQYILPERQLELLEHRRTQYRKLLTMMDSILDIPQLSQMKSYD